MTARLRRGVGAASVALMVATVPAGCFWDKGDDEPSVGQVERNRSITAADLAFVSNGEGRATLVGELINDGARSDKLVGVDVATDKGPVKVTLPRGEVDLPSDEPVKLGPDPTVVVSSEDLKPGFRVDVSLDFARSRSIETTVSVESQTGAYADVTVPPAG